MMNIVKRESLIYSDRGENSNKYYIIEILNTDGMYEVVAKYGRLGKKPAKTTKEFQSEYSASIFYSKKLNEKIKKGYEIVALEDIMFSEGEFFN